jgi:quinol-cytochrome oxidoreductase complex cytochrome b subunit
MDSIRFYPKYLVKDLFGFLSIIGLLAWFTVYLYPNTLGHPDNYIMANSLITPKHIVPEWYFLPFYAILRAIPNKLGGVIAMFSSLLILFIIPLISNYKIKSSKFVIASQILYWSFVTNTLLLGILGACVVEQPYIFTSQVSSIFYFSYFILVLPLIEVLDNNLTNEDPNLFYNLH